MPNRVGRLNDVRREGRSRSAGPPPTHLIGRLLRDGHTGQDAVIAASDTERIIDFRIERYLRIRPRIRVGKGSADATQAMPGHSDGGASSIGRPPSGESQVRTDATAETCFGLDALLLQLLIGGSQVRKRRGCSRSTAGACSGSSRTAIWARPYVTSPLARMPELADLGSPMRARRAPALSSTSPR